MAASPLCWVGPLSSSLPLARIWSAQVHTTSLASGSLLLLEQRLAMCLQVSPELSPGGLIASRKGYFGKGTKSGWAVPAQKHPKQNNKQN